MRLHEDKEAFRALLLDVGQTHGIRADILEKDYYVVLMLRELAAKQSVLPAYFKGGTALYKTLHCIRRFSEDIDLTVSMEDCTSESAKKKRVENAAKDYISLPLLESTENRTGSRSVTRVYAYDSLFPIGDDPLQRFGRVKIEATSFTKSEPHDLIEIAPAVYDLTNDENKTILRGTFGVCPFWITTIKLERIFMDKIFAAEFYYAIPEERRYVETAKHVYDLAVLSALPEIGALFGDERMCAYLAGLKREEEGVRHNSNLKNKPFSEFTIFDEYHTNNEFMRAYASMQRIYVPDAKDVIPVDKLRKAVDEICRRIKTWNF
ncbi:MAG: nucleotidyl transferase AbiEii/AbiGii toxin family protein [Methanomassiliicoccaceae archaeon]|nr:nucleotidyl transferase AbiEii/AbiGii toxin family protein [Methanomassiliicoccaceae archaeon]